MNDITWLILMPFILVTALCVINALRIILRFYEINHRWD